MQLRICSVAVGEQPPFHFLPVKVYFLPVGPIVRNPVCVRRLSLQRKTMLRKRPNSVKKSAAKQYSFCHRKPACHFSAIPGSARRNTGLRCGLCSSPSDADTILFKDFQHFKLTVHRKVNQALVLLPVHVGHHGYRLVFSARLLHRRTGPVLWILRREHFAAQTHLKTVVPDGLGGSSGTHRECKHKKDRLLHNIYSVF